MNLAGRGRTTLAAAVLAWCAVPCAVTSCDGRINEEGTVALWSAAPDDEANPFPEERTVVDGRFTPPEGFAFRFMPSAAITASSEITFARWDDLVAEAGGWGVAAPVAVRFSAPLDAAKLRADAVAFVVPRAPLALEDGGVDDDGDGLPDPLPSLVVPALLRWIADPGYLLATPTAPLPAAARVLVGVRRDLEGGRLARSDDFVARAAGTARPDVDAAALGMRVSGGDELALVFAYRTAAPADEMKRALALVDGVVPSFAFAPPTAPGAVRDDLRDAAAALPAGARVSVGTMAARDLRPAASERPGWAAGVWDLDVAAATPLPASPPLEVLYVLPDGQTHPPPWPTVIALHGFADDRSFGLEMAAPYVERGLAVLAIDASSHGARGSFLGFLRVDDPRIARDHLRQTSVDAAQLANVVRAGGVDVDGVRGADLDGTLLLYGHSMGTFVAAPLAQLDARFDTVALNAPGASFTGLFQGDRLRGALALLLRPALGLTLDDPAYEDALPFCTAVLQTLMEPADTLAFVEERRPLVPPLLLQMSLGDRTLPNDGTLVLARALGVPGRDAPLESAEPVDALWLIDPADFALPADEDPHGLQGFAGAPGVHIQAAEYLASGGRRLTDPTD